MHYKFIDKGFARLDQRLYQVRYAVHLDRHLQAVPVHRSPFRQIVRDDDSNSIALIDLNRWPRHVAVVTVGVHP